MRNVRPIKRTDTLKVKAYKKIKELITTGQLKFGNIYSSNQLAEVLGVSRTPVREALMQLANEGFLTTELGLGYKLKEIPEKKVIEIMEALQLIETYIFKRAVSMVKDEDINKMENILNTMRQIKERDLHAFFETDKAFHMVYVHRYSNAELEGVIKRFRDIIQMFAEMVFSPHGRRIENVIREHEDLLMAIKEKQKYKSIEILVNHLESAREYTIDNIKKFKTQNTKPD